MSFLSLPFLFFFLNGRSLRCRRFTRWGSRRPAAVAAEFLDTASSANDARALGQANFSLSFLAIMWRSSMPVFILTNQRGEILTRPGHLRVNYGHPETLWTCTKCLMDSNWTNFSLFFFTFLILKSPNATYSKTGIHFSPLAFFLFWILYYRLWGNSFLHLTRPFLFCI